MKQLPLPAWASPAGDEAGLEYGEKMKKFAFLALIVLALGAGAYWAFGNMISIPKKSASTILTSLQKTKNIDKLYTGTYLIPVIDLQRGILKRDGVIEGVKTYFNPLKLVDKVDRFIHDKPLIDEKDAKQIVKGCCYKKYEVAFGYDKLMEILNNDGYIQAACTGNLSALPQPQILAVNCQSTVKQGKYDSSGVCYGWDSNDAARKAVIQKAMQEEGILDKVSSRGQESLKNFLSAFCS